MGAKHKFIEHQQLVEAQSKVVKRSEYIDPLVLEPPQLVGATWGNGILSLKLSRPVNQRWILAMQTFGNRTSVMGKGPERFEVSKNIASIASDDSTNQRIIDYFKQ